MSKNLSLDEAAVARGERYSELHNTNLSRLVSDFLSRLPTDEPARELSPIVQRLLGVAGPLATADHEDYRDHLWAKYGGR
ncbi:MAG: DUF6364 family protein [Gemmatimonadaceae bacterium]